MSFRAVRIPGAAMVLLAIWSAPASAQLPSVFPPLSRWMDIWYPKVFWTPREGFTAGGYYGVRLPVTYADFGNPSPHLVAFSLNGQASTSGSRFIRFDAWAPSVVQGWRFRATLAAERWNRENYFGIGNETEIDGSNVTSDQRYFYRARHMRNHARLEIQRQVVGPVRLLAGGHAERWRLDDLGTSQLQEDQANGIASTGNTSDVSGRVGLVVDTRNNEAAPERGVLIEIIHAVADADFAGDLTYTRTTASVRAFIPVSERVGLATRVLAQGMGGEPGTGSLYLIEAGDAPFTGLGGPDAHRALPVNQRLGKDKVLANLDVRYILLPFPRVTGFAFLDMGRVFHEPVAPNDNLRLTLRGMAVGGGMGLMTQWGGDGFLGMSLGLGPDGVVGQVYTRWGL